MQLFSSSDESEVEAVQVTEAEMDLGNVLLDNPFDSKFVEAPLPARVGFLDNIRDILKQKKSVAVSINEEEEPVLVESKDENTLEEALPDKALKDETAVEETKEAFISFAEDPLNLLPPSAFKFTQVPVNGPVIAAPRSRLPEKWASWTTAQRDAHVNEITKRLTWVEETPLWFNASTKQDPDVLKRNGTVYRSKSLARILHAEIEDYVAWVSPTESERRMRIYLFERISAALHTVIPGCTLKIFGSFETNLYLPCSDVDIVIFLPSLQPDERPSFGLMNRIGTRLEEAGLVANDGGSGKLATSLQIINARVPIIKFRDAITQFSVDLSFQKDNGPRAARIMSQYLTDYPALRPLTMLLKHVLVIRGLNEVFSGGLGSYGVLALVTSFLQIYPKLQSGEILGEENLGVLFIELLELYGKKFDYQNVGIAIKSDDWGYFHKYDQHRLAVDKPYGLMIEDPEDPENDITRGSYNIAKIRQMFSYIYDVLTGTFYEYHAVKYKPKNLKDKYFTFRVYSILSTIIKIPNAWLVHRKHVDQKYWELKELVDAAVEKYADAKELFDEHISRASDSLSSSDEATSDSEKSPPRKSLSRSQIRKRKQKLNKERKKRKRQESYRAKVDSYKRRK